MPAPRRWTGAATPPPAPPSWCWRPKRARASDADSVATVGQLLVPSGSINVVPGRCQFSLDMRAPSDAQRDALVRDVLASLDEICNRRQLRYTLEETMRAVGRAERAGLAGALGARCRQPSACRCTA